MALGLSPVTSHKCPNFCVCVMVYEKSIFCISSLPDIVFHFALTEKKIDCNFFCWNVVLVVRSFIIQIFLSLYLSLSLFPQICWPQTVPQSSLFFVVICTCRLCFWMNIMTGFSLEERMSCTRWDWITHMMLKRYTHTHTKIEKLAHGLHNENSDWNFIGNWTYDISKVYWEL